MAKLHVRHMVGGRATARDERLYRFEFPERPGALMEFLEKHRRAAGTSASSTTATTAPTSAGVLTAFEVPDAELAELRSFLDRLGYPRSPRSRNPAYSLFLAGNRSPRRRLIQAALAKPPLGGDPILVARRAGR